MSESSRTYKTNASPLKFFVLTFALSWLIWIPLDLSHFGIGPLHIPDGAATLISFVGVLMPATVAIILTGRGGGRWAVGGLLSRLGIWTVGWKWWAAATLVFPLLLVVTALVHNRFIGIPPITLAAPVSGAALIINVIFLLNSLAGRGNRLAWCSFARSAAEEERPDVQRNPGIVLGDLAFALLAPTR